MAKQTWKKHLHYYSDFTAKHVATEGKSSKDVEELSGGDAVYLRPLSPTREAVSVTESQTPSGTYLFGVVDHLLLAFSFQIVI